MPRTRNTHTTPSVFFIAIILMLPFLAHASLTLRNRRLHVWVEQVVPQLVSASGPAARGWLDHQPERVRRKQRQRGSQRPSSHGGVSAPVSDRLVDVSRELHRPCVLSALPRVCLRFFLQAADEVSRNQHAPPVRVVVRHPARKSLIGKFCVTLDFRCLGLGTCFGMLVRSTV